MRWYGRMAAVCAALILHCICCSAQRCIVGDSWTGHDDRGVARGGLSLMFDESEGRQGATLEEIENIYFNYALYGRCDTLVLIGGINSYRSSFSKLVEEYVVMGIRAREHGKVLYVCQYPYELEIVGGQTTMNKINRAVDIGKERGGYTVIYYRKGILQHKDITGFHLTQSGYRKFGKYINSEIDRLTEEKEKNYKTCE